MKFPSITLILSGVFLGYVLYSIWSIFQLFMPPKCTGNEFCLPSLLKSKPELQILGYASGKYIDVASKPSWNEIFKFDEKTMWAKTLPVSPRLLNNGSLYLHVFILPKRRRSIRLEDLDQDSDVARLRIKLTQMHTPVSATFKLLGSNEKHQDKSSTSNSLPSKVNHFKRKVTVNMLSDPISLPYGGIPPEMQHMFQLTDNREYVPPVQYNFLATRLSDLEEITADLKELNITLIYSPTTFGKMRFLVHIENSLHSLKALGFTDRDLDDIKNIFEETNLWVLCVTIFVSSIHILFDFLSFKNDVYFWRKRSDLVGVSGRTVLWQSFSRLVIFLYLLDSNTSHLVLVPAGFGQLIEFWKVTKVVQVKIKRTNWGMPVPEFHLQGSSKGERLTQKLDAEAMRYLTYLLIPVCIAGAVYSLLYEPHRGWYSWTINSLVNGVYAFGFLFMLPQLFINYRLKSVAHMPWRAFMYKAFNTFIDDVFAFIITMPTAHRVACFRDDVVFVVFLYQRWLYPVDKSRTDATDGTAGIKNSDKND